MSSKHFKFVSRNRIIDGVFKTDPKKVGFKPNPGFKQQLKEFEQKLLECDYDLDNIDIAVEEWKFEEVKHSEPDGSSKDTFKDQLDELTKTESNQSGGALDFLDNVKLDGDKDSHFKFAGIDDILK